MQIAAETWADPPLRRRAALEIVERLAMACCREELLSYELEKNHLKLISVDGRELSLELSMVHSMGRFDLKVLPEELEEDPIESFLSLLFPHLSEEKRERLLSELSLSHLNLALSLTALDELGSGTPGEGTLADWEARVWCGHPLHPGARLRSGLTAEENRRFGPEWMAELQLPLLSVPQESVAQVGRFTERIKELFPSLQSPGDGRVLIPVHPWQKERDLKERFRERFQSGELKFTGQSLPARPTMSFRTVILETEIGEDFHLKLPVAVQTTGATRTVSVASTQNGPLMSGFLKKLVAQPGLLESRLFHHLHLMAEPASFYLGGEDPDRSRFLSAILRFGPEEHRELGKRWLLPVAALLEPRENPLFMRAARYFETHPVTFFTTYSRRLLPPLAYLCGRFGIALEAHPQNMLVDFRGPGPDIHFWYRDLGGIRLHPGRLEQGLKEKGWEDRLEVPRFWPGSATSTDSVRDLSSKFVYSLLQNHLGELIRAISRHGVAEADLWPVVDEILWEHRSLMGEDLEGRVFAEEWDLKAMWTMRVDSRITEYTFRPVQNPLLQFRKTVTV